MIGTIGPFYNANRFDANGGAEVDRELLVVNNNHYEPVFDDV